MLVSLFGSQKLFWTIFAISCELDSTWRVCLWTNKRVDRFSWLFRNFLPM